ncbi:MAG TPA: two-component regulator propeller domain-containing protein, partial [Chitinophagaceae bacterium]|nr:two-component regulator propeller domain-containing protein [Chitinophagaceae bacterium]
MHFRLFTIIIAAACAVHFCNGQDNHNQKLLEKTVYIAKYDSNPPPLNFRSFTYKDGLPRGVINTFVQSDDGFIWLGILKIGIVRFDGYHFRIFNPIMKGTHGLFDDYIFQIVKSHRKGLWIASASGIIWFDFSTYKTRIIPLPPGLWRTFYHLFEDSQQRLWVYWEHKLYLYDASAEKFTEIKDRVATNAFTGKKVNIEIARFIDMKETVNGDLFLGGNTILKFNPISFAFTVYKEIDDHIPYTTFVFDEDNENIWLSGWGGLLKFDLRNNNRLLYDFENTGSQKNIENHSFVSPKNATQLWLPNEQQIRVFDKITDKVSIYNKSNSENLLVTRSHEKGINGIDWFWSYKNGFSSLLPAVNRFVYRKLLPESERVICQWHDQKNNTIWYGTEDRGMRPHLYKYDKGTDKINRIEIPVHDRGDLRFIIPLQNDICLLAFADIILSYKTNSVYSKLFLLNTRTNKLTYFVKPMINHPGCTTDSVKYRNTFADKEGNYWMTTEGNGLVHFDTKTLQFFQYVSDPKDSTTLTSNFVYSVACGDDNTIWTGSDYELDSVLNKLDVATGKVHRIPLFPYNYRVQPLCEDKKGNVWISTNSGLVCYNRYSEEKYKVKEIPELITRAYIDTNGNIIALAQDGLWFYDPVKRLARRFDELDGIRLEYFEDD